MSEPGNGGRAGQLFAPALPLYGQQALVVDLPARLYYQASWAPTLPPTLASESSPVDMPAEKTSRSVAR